MPVKNDAEKPVVDNKELEKVSAERDALKAELDQVKKEAQALQQKYNRLFGLFANNVDYIIGNV